MTALDAHEVRVLRFELDGDATDARALLSPDERERADRFVFEIHRRRFTNARAALRRSLGDLLGAGPRELVFAYAERGKPSLPAAPFLHFNLSHSGSRALIAATHLAPVGVDIEEHREIELEAVARRTFSEAELTALFALPEPERFPAFYRIWSRKEAVVKARGIGIGADLTGFDVPVERGARGLRAMRWPGEQAEQWTLVEIEAGPHAAAAVALPHPDARVSVPS